MPLRSELELAAVGEVLGTRLVPVSLMWILEVGICNTRLATCNQRTNGPVNAHLISRPSTAQNIQNLEKIW